MQKKICEMHSNTGSNCDENNQENLSLTSVHFLPDRISRYVAPGGQRYRFQLGHLVALHRSCQRRVQATSKEKSEYI